MKSNIAYDNGAYPQKQINLYDNMLAGYWEIDLEGNFTFINKIAAEFLGADTEDLIEKRRQLPQYDEITRKVMEICDYVQRTGKPVRGIAFDVTSADGRDVSLELFITLIRDHTGNPVGFSGVTIDRTEQKKAETARLESEARYRTILETIEDGYYEVDLEGRLTFFNKAMASINGYPPDEMMGMTSKDYAASQQDIKHLHKEFLNVYKTGIPAKGIQYRVRTKDGSVKHLQTSASLLKGKTGEIIGFKGIARDISPYILIQNALQESEELHRSIINTSPNGIAFFDTEYKMLMINPAGLKLFGYENQDEITGKTILKHIPFEIQAEITESFQREIRPDQIYSNELLLSKKDGSTFPAEVRSGIITEGNNVPKGFLFIPIWRYSTAKMIG